MVVLEGFIDGNTTVVGIFLYYVYDCLVWRPNRTLYLCKTVYKENPSGQKCSMASVVPVRHMPVLPF